MLDIDIQKLIKYYIQGQSNLINIIAKKTAKGNVTQYHKDLLKQVNQEVDKLNTYAKKWTKDYVPKTYNNTIGELVSNPQIDVSFSGLDNRAIQILVTNTTDSLITANNFVGRQINDTIRQNSLDVITQTQLTGGTIKDAQKALYSKLVSEGFSSIKDKRGRNMNLDSYAATVARSTTAETQNTATITRLTENDYDLVQITSHAGSCAICANFQGRIYSISGKDTRFPPLDDAMGGGYANIHPNCRHRVTPYIERFNNVAEDIKKSNKPYTDNRSQEQKDKYDNKQQQNRKQNTDRRQWEKMKLSGIDNVPKTLSAFRSMKKAKSEKYQSIIKKYKLITLA